MLSNLIIFLLLFLVSCNYHNDAVSLGPIFLWGLGILFIILGIMYFFTSRNRINWVDIIRKIYLNTKNQLHFWDKLDRMKLEDYLQKNKLPENWIVSLNREQTKIADIYFYNGLEVKRIAQDKKKLFESLRSRLPKN